MKGLNRQGFKDLEINAFSAAKEKVMFDADTGKTFVVLADEDGKELFGIDFKHSVIQGDRSDFPKDLKFEAKSGNPAEIPLVEFPSEKACSIQ